MITKCWLVERGHTVIYWGTLPSQTHTWEPKGSWDGMGRLLGKMGLGMQEVEMGQGILGGMG